MLITIDLLSPLAHGAFSDVSAGNATMLRREPIVGLPGMPRVPVLSGNALRGTCRRIVMRHLIARVGLSREYYDQHGTPRKWDRLYAALANGGHLDGSESRIKPAGLRVLRESLPALSVFGAALYSFMLPGRMRVGMCWLVCEETIEAGLCVGDPDSPPAEDQVSEFSMCRHIDRDEHDPKESGVTPMPTTIETISTGARLQCHVGYARGASDIERAVLPWALDHVEALGGKSASGLGAVKITHDGESAPYQDWLDNAATDAQAAVLALSDSLL